MTKAESSLEQAVRLKTSVDSEVATILSREDYPPEAKEQALALQDDLDAVNDLLTEYKKIPMVRTSAGQGGVMYLDAILRMIDGLTEAAEAIVTGLQLYKKAARKITELGNMDAQQATAAGQSALEAAKAKSFFADMGGIGAVIGATGSSIDVSGFKISGGGFGTMEGAVSALSTESAKIGASVASMAALKKAKGGLYSVDSAIAALEGALAIAYAAQKIIQVVIQTISWAMAVIGVEAVPKLPIPISGWDIMDPYDWVPGDIIPTIEPFIPPIIKGMTSPTEIIQGALVTPLINEFIPNEVYEVPKMPFLGGGSIF